MRLFCVGLLLFRCFGFAIIQRIYIFTCFIIMYYNVGHSINWKMYKNT